MRTAMSAWLIPSCVMSDMSSFQSMQSIVAVANIEVNRYSECRLQSLVQTQCMETIGKRIKRLIEAKKMSQRQVALACDISASHMTELIGDVKDPHKLAVGSFMALCTHLEVTPEFLYYGACEEGGSVDIEQALLSSFRTLKAEQRPIALSVIRAMHTADGPRQNDTGSSTDAQSIMTPPNSESGDPAASGSSTRIKQGRHGKNTSVQLQEHHSRTRRNQPKA